MMGGWATGHEPAACTFVGFGRSCGRKRASRTTEFARHRRARREGRRTRGGP